MMSSATRQVRYTAPEFAEANGLRVCYDAFGGQDFLNDGENAFVFPNHHVYPLVEKTLALTGEAADEAALRAMRLRARESVARYDMAATGAALAHLFRRLAATIGGA